MQIFKITRFLSSQFLFHLTEQQLNEIGIVSTSKIFMLEVIEVHVFWCSNFAYIFFLSVIRAYWVFIAYNVGYWNSLNILNGNTFFLLIPVVKVIIVLLETIKIPILHIMCESLRWLTISWGVFFCWARWESIVCVLA